MLDLLAKVPQLRVHRADLVVLVQGQGLSTPRPSRRQLGVSHLLEGSVRKSGQSPAYQRQARSRGLDSSQLWSETYDRELEDVFKIQDEIAGAVVAQLEVTMLGTVDAGEPAPPIPRALA